MNLADPLFRFHRVRLRAAKFVAPLAFASVFLGGGPRADAQVVLTSIWLSDVAPSPGLWSTATNWTALLLPQPGYNVTINNGLIVPTVVTQDVDASVASLTLGSGASLSVSGNKTLTIGANSTVAGTLRANSNATISIQSNTLTNTSGTLAAQTGSTLVLSNATISGGNITLDGSAALQLSAATLSNVTLSNSASGVVHAVSGVNAFLGSYLDAVGSQARVDNGAKLSLQGAPSTATINGGLFLDSSGSDTVLEIAIAGLTVSGPGQLTLSNNANNRVIGSGTNAAVTFGANFTVQGAGQLGAGLLGFTNQGTILANRPTMLEVKPSALGFSNSGTLRTTGGATLGLSNGTFTNTSSGMIVADDNSFVDVSGSTIIGGILTSIGAGHFHALNSSTFSGLTISAGTKIEIGNGETLTLAGGIVNNGSISLLSSGSSTDLKIDGVTLSGTGNLTLTDSANNRIYAAGGSSALTLGANQTLTGAGQLGRDTLALTNQGTVIANGTNPLVINNSGSAFTNAGSLKATGTVGLTLSDASVTNQGTLEVATGSTLTATGALTQTGAASVTKLSGGALSTTTFALQGGTLTGAGTVSGPVTATGDARIIPGGIGGAGALTFNSTLTLGPNTGLYFDIGGTSAGSSYDRINGTNVVLNGSLQLAFTSGFQSLIRPTDSFTLINASTALSGTFTGVANGSRLNTTDGFGSFQVNYLANTLTISNFQAVPEPATWALIGLGTAVVAWTARRKTR